MDRKRKQYIQSCEVSTVETAMLGGYRQKFAIEGRSKELPVVIYLHGGPGLPVPFSVGTRGIFPDITDRIILVAWDQLGCGANNLVIDNSFTVEHFVRMAVDLIYEIKRRFPENKLCLCGTSWGSLLSLHAAARVPELIDSVIVYGQILTSPFISQRAFETIECSAAPEKKKAFARMIRTRGTDLTLEELRAYLAIIREYTEGYFNRNSEPVPKWMVIKGMLTSTDYRLKDFLAVVRNGHGKNESLLREVSQMDLRKMLAGITVPYHIFQGETDLITDTAEVLEYTKGLNNANVSCTVVPDEGHFPSVKTMNKLLEATCLKTV